MNTADLAAGQHKCTMINSRIAALPHWSFMHDIFSRIRQFAPDVAAAAELDVGDEVATLSLHDDKGVSWTADWPLGWVKLSREVFKGEHPSELSVEHAIAHIEEAVMPNAHLIPPATTLVASGSKWQPWVPQGMHESDAIVRLGIDAVERLFNDWIARMPHAARNQAKGSEGHQFAAQMLIVRELMHHMRINEFLIIDAAVEGQDKRLPVQ